MSINGLTSSRGPLNGKIYPCITFNSVVCGQRFIQLASLEKHQRVHDKLREFECEEQGCNKTFTQVSIMLFSILTIAS